MEHYKNWLQKQGYEAKTIAGYLQETTRYQREITAEKAQSASYKDILDYLQTLRKQYSKAGTIHNKLNAIKRWYDYLTATGQRKTHPCKRLRIKSKRPKDLQADKLFSKEELEKLLELPFSPFLGERVSIRNKVIVSLLVYQGISSGEVSRIKVTDVNLEKASLYIAESPHSKRRTLPLHSKQILLFHQYISKIRPQFIKETGSGYLVVTRWGKQKKSGQISKLLNQLQPHFKGKEQKAYLIRQSVIAEKFKEGKDLRIVQVFAGHKKTASTERYRLTQLEELKTAIDQYHPLK